MKKLFFLTVISIFVFVFVSFLTVKYIDNKSVPYEESTEENITKVNAIEPEVEIMSKVVNPITLAEKEIEEPLSFCYPVSGEIGLTYSPDNLVYSKTLDEWTTHNGIDIQAKRGTPVLASEEGIVESITETSAKGIEITLSHRDDYKTVYSNLSTKEMVKTGQKVEKGRVISGVGNTASFEYYEPEHLHFEMYKNNKAINPLEVLVGD